MNSGDPIAFEARYRSWLTARGVGDRDRVASSPNSYCSYLRSAAALAGVCISPETVPDQAAADRMAEAAASQQAAATVRNYRSALRQYAAMVEGGWLSSSPDELGSV